MADWHLQITKLEQPLDVERMETGPVQFGEDWPGIFLRGDTTIILREMANSALDRIKFNDSIEDTILANQLHGFLGMLQTCEVKGKNDG